MSTRKQRQAIRRSIRKQIQGLQRLSERIRRLFPFNRKQLKRRRRVVRVIRRRPSTAKSGFVLPTVTMVSLVVVLLTTAMMIRSFDRSKYANNVRVNEIVLNAASPALDRARAKIDALFTDPTLPRTTPSDIDLHQAIASNITRYTLGDEQPLKLVHDIGNGKGGNPNNTIESLEDGSASRLDYDETLTTAWKFPVDIDNNGKYDSYTLYGIYFRSPTQNEAGQTNRQRNPLEARTPPMENAIAGSCATALGTSASLVGNSGWYSSSGQFKKSFYVYTATVPIINPPTGNEYEAYKGTRAFSALEFHQDRALTPLSNHAIVYENDLEISPDNDFRLNGGIFTNGNLLIGNNNQEIELYQVSSKDSCFYQKENSKIVVGGNVANGGVTANQDQTEVNVHLFNGAEKDIAEASISSTNKSTWNTPKEVGYNSLAYAQRIALLVDTQMENSENTDPEIVRQAVEAEENKEVPLNEPEELRTERIEQVRREQLEIYFKNRTRRVPFKEVEYGSEGQGKQTKSSVLLKDNNDPETLRPPEEWIYPTDPSNGETGTTYTELNLNPNQLEATEPQALQESGIEKYIGDRIQVGNNLPTLWYKDGIFVGAKINQEILGTTWKDSPQMRYRTTHVHQLTDLDITDRDGFWEEAAAAKPITAVDNIGGLRVVTGAGVYERKNSFLPPPTYDDPTTPAIENTLTTYDDPATETVEEYPIVWSDTMPMSPGLQVYDNAAAQPEWKPLPEQPEDIATPTIDPDTPKYAKGDLRMRASAIYHYTQDAYDPDKPTDYQAPIACVSNYYDPTDSITARNLRDLPDVSGDLTEQQPEVGTKSNNGVVYGKPTIDAGSLSGIRAPNQITGLFDGNEDATTIQERLQHQANLKFPNGRFVNEPLSKALKKKASNQNLTLSEQSAIDSTVCAFQILDGSITPDPSLIPHGAIKEIAFLDARQIKAIEDDNPETYPLETFTTDGNPTVEKGDAILTGNYNVIPAFAGNTSTTSTISTALSIEERQPLEIRATVLDLNALRQKRINGGLTQEYLLPNSGIIYASRDDALPDLSDKSLNSYDDTPNIADRKLLSPVDFKLDPTRRPNGILLSEGSELWREEEFREAEKGLILATNLPVYIKGDFNLHSGEEFNNLLDADWNNFYRRRKEQINYDFACRPKDPRLPNCTTGDTWRPATVLADAIALLSNDFRFGFRNEGDYDLRNNQGNANSITERKKNGFWNNNFVTNGLSSGGITINDITPTDADYTSVNSTNAVDSSYFNNFVTPIQRRGNFPEYLMEVCTKLPVSECESDDWYVNPEQKQKAYEVLNSNFNITNHPSGTTAQAAALEYQRYARRVAFARKPDNTLDFTANVTPTSNTATVKPIGVDSNGQIKSFPYPFNRTNNSNDLPPSVPNALWFRTTNNTNDNPGLEADITYASNKPLYYLPPEQGGNKLILPDVPDIEGVTTSLNLPEGDQSASDYAVCNQSGGSSQSYESNKGSLESPTSGNERCPEATKNVIKEFYEELIALNLSNPEESIDAPNNTIKNLKLTARQRLNVYELTKDTFANEAAIELDANGIPDTIFVLKAESLKFGENCRRNNCRSGVAMKLTGVKPNNVFWVIGDELRFENVNNTTHTLFGNFIGNNTISIGKDTKITGRVLGFTNIRDISNENVTITAITADEQPLLVPVLQFHSTGSTLGNNPNNGGTPVEDTRWAMRASETTYNLVAAAGDTPTRVNTTVAEGNGGLPNFVRFLENWRDEIPAKISGSFIQFKRSVYATAPFTTTFSNEQGGIFNYRQAYETRNGEIDNNSNWGSLPYFVPPQRQWSFDVALLSQLTDLFSQKFTLPTTSESREFFRQASRDDEWVQSLLCAAVNENPGVDSTYEKYAVDDEQRPNCPRQINDY